MYDTPRNDDTAVYDTPRNDDSAVYDTPRNYNSAVYLTPRELHSKNQNNLGGVRYAGETFAKQMKAATALKGTILKKTTRTSHFYHIEW